MKKNNLIKENPKLSYFVLFLLIAPANFPFFVGNRYLVVFTAITALLFFHKRYTFNKFIIRYMTAFIVIMVFQILITGNLIWGPFWGILLRIAFAYMAIKIIGINFPKYYVNFIYFFSIIGLFFWFIIGFIPGMYDIFRDISINYIRPFELYHEHIRNNLIIYTNEYWLLSLFPRNAGPIGEPGGYGVLLVVAILLNTMITKKLNHRKNIVFIFSLITTFSLGTYIAFLIFILAYIFYVNRFKQKPSFILSSILIIFFVVNYSEYEFLGAKLERREKMVSVTLNDNTMYSNLNYKVGRNDQIRLDLKSFFTNPVFGEGQFTIYKYGSSAGGLTAFLRKWGIVGFLVFFGSMYYSFKKYVIYKKIHLGFAKVSVITIIAVGLSQSIYGKPVFIGFSVLFLVFDQVKYFKKPNLNKIIDEQ